MRAKTDLLRTLKKYRLRFLLNLVPTNYQKQILERSKQVTFLPMEAIGEKGELDLSLVRDKEVVSTGYTLFFEGDVVVAKITPCFENGKGAIIKGTLTGVGFGTTELYVLSPKPELDASLLYYLTVSPQFRLLGEAHMTGAAGQKRVPEDFIKNYPTPFLSLLEQRAIANFLDRQTTQLDKLIAAKERLLVLLAEKRRALITQAVTRGLKADVPMRDSGIEWLGEIPKHWNIFTLKRLANLKSGETITADSIEEEGIYPVYGGNGLRGYTSTFTHSGYYVLIGRQGALCGNINYAQEQFWASEHAVVVSPVKPLETKWLGELLRVMNLNQYSISAAQPGLSVEIVSNLYLPVPPLDEQQTIVIYIETETQKLDALKAATERTINLLKERRSSLIAAAVTGQIVVGEQV